MNNKTLCAILKLSPIDCTYCQRPMQVHDAIPLDDVAGDLFLLRVVDNDGHSYAVYSISNKAMNSGGTFCYKGGQSTDWKPWEDGIEASHACRGSFGKRENE
jgi:hypothetical protein